MDRVLTSEIKFESWVPKMEFTGIGMNSTAITNIPISVLRFEVKEEMIEVQNLPKQEFWVADLGAHWEFNRKDIYDKPCSYRREHLSLCS